MTATIDTTTIDESLDAELIIKAFEALLINPDDKKKGDLWYAWHYLQVYAYWGLRLPNTDATLKLKLGITDPGAYLFYDTMLEGYQQIHEAGEFFLTVVFPNMIDLGNDLLSFASTASDDSPDGIFSTITASVDSGDTQAALQLLDGLQAQARQNADNAKKLYHPTKEGEQNTSLLARFQTMLNEASSRVNAAGKKIDEDSKTSQATIDKLSAGTDNKESLAAIQKMITDKREEYNQDVVIAATTPTYAWIVIFPIPIGLIAATTVAAIYGPKAVQALKDLDTYQALFDKKSAELKTAVITHAVQETAKTAITEAITHTGKAIIYTSQVQNAWNKIAPQIGIIRDRVVGMTTENNSQKVLSEKATIKAYVYEAKNAWKKILPPLTDLTENPFITVQSNEVSLADFVKQVQQEIDKGNKPA